MIVVIIVELTIATTITRQTACARAFSMRTMRRRVNVTPECRPESRGRVDGSRRCCAAEQTFPVQTLPSPPRFRSLTGSVL